MTSKGKSAEEVSGTVCDLFINEDGLTSPPPYCYLPALNVEGQP